jgi:chromosome partitioning protein
MILSITIHKGGTGKTTVAVNLVHLLQEKGKKVLLLDLDPQGNATYNFRKDIADGIEIKQASNLFSSNGNRKILSVSPNLSIIPSDPNLKEIERYPIESIKTFRDNIRQISNNFDQVIIDTPPTMGFGMSAALIASDFAVAPVIPDAYSIHGALSLLTRIKEIKRDQNPKLEFLGLLVNQFDKRSQAQIQVVEALKRLVSDNVIPHAIGAHVAIGYSAHNGHAVWHNARNGAHKIAAKTVKTSLDYILNLMEAKAK